MDFIPREIPDIRHVEKKTIINFMLYILLLLPDNVYRICTVYLSKTPDYILYRWLNYSFNVIHLVILICGTVIALFCHDRILFGIVGLMALREVIFLFLNNNSCITNSAYEIYLTLFTGIAFLKIVENNCRDASELESFFWKSIFLNVLTVFVAPILGAGIFSETYSRFNAVNMDVGSTGTICVMLVIFCCFSKTVINQILIAGIAITALFISGSRVNLLLLILVLFVGASICALRDHRIRKKWFCFAVGCVVLGIIVATVILIGNHNVATNVNNGLGRMLDAFSFNRMGNDDSVMGRTTSIIAGIDIIKNNPFGISGFFINLQNETIQRGFPTFPHSSLIDYYIFWGPIIIVFLIRIVICLKRLYLSNQIAQFLVLAYLILFVTLSGGPIINFKIVFFYALLFKISFLKENMQNQIRTKRYE